MPLDEAGNVYQPALELPAGLCFHQEVYVCRFTGELFPEYTDYLKALSLYRSRIWKCARTGMANMTFEEALASEANPVFPKTTLPSADNVAFPHVYIKPCLELVHGATTRLDELCNTIVNFLRCNCIPDEVVQLLPKSGTRRDAVVKYPVQGQESNATNKQYIVEVDGTTQVVAMSQLGRACYQLTKAAVKAWLNSVSRQQSLGIKGMTCVWLVRPELLTEMHIPDKLPKHIDQQLRKTAKRREQRQRAKQRAKETEPGMHKEPHQPAAAAQLSGRGPAHLIHQTSGLPLQGTQDVGGPGDAASHSQAGMQQQLMLQQLAQRGFKPHQLQQMLQSNTLQNFLGGEGGVQSHATTDTSTAQGAAAFSAASLAQGGAAASCATANAPSHILDDELQETEARLETGSLKRGIFMVLKDAGPRGLGVSDIMEGLKQYGFDWGANTRGGKSSIASTCRHDNIFLRLGPGRFTLRALPGALDHVDASATCSRQELEAVKAVCTLEAKQAAAQAQMTSCGLKKQPFVKNTFKCSRCMRVYHPSGSPLVLCDYCPKAFHVSCLQGATMADLPVGEWACPKCHEKQAANKQKLEDLAAKHKEALERVATAERKREKQAAKRALDKGERERRKTDTRPKEGQKRGGINAPGPEQDLPLALDDLDVVQEEVLALKALEEAGQAGELGDSAAVAAICVAHALDHDNSRLESTHIADPMHRLVQLRMRVQGPPQPHWVTHTARDTKLLREALSVVEFAAVMQPVLLGEPIMLPALLAAVHQPASSQVLPELYATLLRSCLLEVVHLEAPLKRSRAKRWGRVLDRHTWPEVLRRYLLATRAGLPMSDEHLAAADVADLAADAVAVHAALQLGRKPWWTLSAALHTLILSVLCDDVVQGTRLRADINLRFEEIAALHAERVHSQAEERKRERENARVRRDKLQTLRDIEARAEAENLSSDAKPTAAEMAEAQSLREELAMEAEEDRRGAQHGHKAKEREREAEFEKRLDSKAVRADMLGWDRHQQSYWWMQSTAHVLWVFGPEAEKMGVYHTTEQLNALYTSLLESGVRERGLAQGLITKYEALQENLAVESEAKELLELTVSFTESVPTTEQGRNGAQGTKGGSSGGASGDNAAPTQGQAAPDAVQQQQQAILTAAAKAQLTALLQICRECNLSVEECERLRSTVQAATADTMVEVLRLVESKVARFSEGLPKEADDANMAGPVAEVELYRAEFVLPAPRKSDEAKADERESNANRAAAASEEDMQENHEGDEGGEDCMGGCKALASAQVVAALEELDDSDAEPESKSGSTYDEFGNRYPNKPLRLWRTRRDRTVWLKDVRRAELMGSATGLVFCCATLLDRVRPMTVRIQNRMNTQRAERVARAGSAASGEDGGEDHSEAGQDGTAGMDATDAGGPSGVAVGAPVGGSLIGSKRELDMTNAPTGGGPPTKRKLNRPLWDTMFRCLADAQMHGPGESSGKVPSSTPAPAGVPSRSASTLPAAVDEAAAASDAETQSL